MQRYQSKNKNQYTSKKCLNKTNNILLKKVSCRPNKPHRIKMVKGLSKVYFQLIKSEYPTI